MALTLSLLPLQCQSIHRSLLPLQCQSIHRLRNAQPVCCKAQVPDRVALSLTNRRGLLFLITAAPALVAKESTSVAEDIPLFGLRKRLKKAEEAAEEFVKEGFGTAEKELEKVEKEVVAAEKGLETAEREIEEAVISGGVAQAGVVAGAEVVGVLVGTAIVNGILGPEAQES